MASSLAKTDWLLASASSHLEQQKLYSFYKYFDKKPRVEPQTT